MVGFKIYGLAFWLFSGFFSQVGFSFKIAIYSKSERKFSKQIRQNPEKFEFVPDFL